MIQWPTVAWSTAGRVAVGLLEVSVDVVDVDDGEVEAVLPGARGHQRDTPREQDKIAVRGILSQIDHVSL